MWFNSSCRNYRWPHRLMIKLIVWAIKNEYMLFKSVSPNIAKKCTLMKFLDQFSLDFVGAYRITAVQREVRDRNVPAWLQNEGLHHPEIPADGFKDSLHVVCSYKFNKFNKKHICGLQKLSSQSSQVCYPMFRMQMTPLSEKKLHLLDWLVHQGGKLVQKTGRSPEKLYIMWNCNGYFKILSQCSSMLYTLYFPIKCSGGQVLEKLLFGKKRQQCVCSASKWAREGSGG